MRRILHLLPVLVVLAGIGIITHYAMESRNQKKEQEAAKVEEPPAAAPVADTLAPMDQALVNQVFDDPETLDSVPEPVPAKALDHHASLANRPPLMPPKIEETDKREAYLESDAMKAAPPYVKGFASLRTDAVRNPDSEQNRAAVRSIMKKRAQRISQLDRSKIEL